MNNPSRFVTTDQVAKKIIEADPTLFLIDTRPFDQYESYSLPGAVNIPLEKLLDTNGLIFSEWMDYLDIEGVNAVFFSNSDITADQVWVICSRQGIDNLYVMKGGLNYWVETILKPEKPVQSAPSEDFALYDFRKGASQFFGAGTISIEAEVISEPVPRMRKKKKTVASGGC